MESTNVSQKALPPLLDSKVPDFEAKTTHGPIRLSEWAGGSWVILFSHPADFTPVCTTEFMAFASREDAFAERDVKLLGLSVDSVHSHIGWVMNIEQNFGVKVGFPIIADLDTSVARAFGMIHPDASTTATVRSVFIIDPQLKLRASLQYPMSVGRNFDELLRLVDALQTTDKEGVATPADWRPGEAVIVPPPKTVAEAKARMASSPDQVTDWYFARRALPAGR